MALTRRNSYRPEQRSHVVPFSSDNRVSSDLAISVIHNQNEKIVKNVNSSRLIYIKKVRDSTGWHEWKAIDLTRFAHLNDGDIIRLVPADLHSTANVNVDGTYVWDVKLKRRDIDYQYRDYDSSHTGNAQLT